MSRTLSENYTWNTRVAKWEDVSLPWESLESTEELGPDFLHIRFNEANLYFNLWDKYFADTSSLWNNEQRDYNNPPSPDVWEGADFLWTKKLIGWNDFHPQAPEVYSGHLLTASNIDYSAGEWEDITTDWEDYQLGWSSLVLELEDTSVSSLTTTSRTNIVPIWDFSKINNNWEDLSNEWDSMYLGVE